MDLDGSQDAVLVSEVEEVGPRKSEVVKID